MPKSGFTLIELSIVLVIIGLIVGGVLVGRDLISAATLRAQITQIEKYNQAVNAFRGKYGYLPGDIKDPEASSFGFIARGSAASQGDGNGLLEGWDTSTPFHYGLSQSAGETVVLWRDLSAANLIDGSFTTASITTAPGSDISSANVPKYLPAAKLGGASFVYAYGGAYWNGTWYLTGKNYFAVSNVTGIQGPVCCGRLLSTPSFTVAQAYNIDKKIDDGYPQTGIVVAQYLNRNDQVSPAWSAGGGAFGPDSGAPYYSATTAATAGSATTCYDNNSTAGAELYSISQNNGTGVNCSLSFQFQ